MFTFPRTLLLAGLCAAPLAQAALVANANGTVTDTTTQLVWDQCVRGRATTDTACDSGSVQTYTWAAALTEVVARNSANHLGFNDWRLPNVRELESIVKLDGAVTAIDATVFPNTPTTGDSWNRGGHWTSSTYMQSADTAWLVLFNLGLITVDSKATINLFVRLVRSGQSFAPFDRLLPVVNGSCGSAHATTPLITSAPSTNLCGLGSTAGSVTAGTSAYTWSCAGSNSGTTASCSASRGYTVTASAGANGSIDPSNAQVVAHNATPAFTLTPNTGYAASATGCGGSLSGNTYTTAAVTADCAVSASFTGNDSTPDAFSFTAANGVALGTVQTSNSITVAGINAAATISVGNGEYQINSAGWTSASGTVNNNDTVTVRHTASATNNASVSTTLNIGGVTANFVSTTMAASAVNGSCGSAHTPTPFLTSAPSTNLCGVGSTASSVTAGTSTYNWTCAGSNGGTTASCSAGRGYTVTPSAGANGSLSPSTQQVVAYNATPTFTVTPASGYSAASVTGCAGSLNGSTYTTGGITADCAVSASFSLNTRYNGGAPTGSGSVEAVLSGGPTCGFASVGYQAASAVAPLPAGMTFPHGVLAFTTNTCATGGSVSVTLTYPQALPANAKFYKYGPPAAGQASQWYEHPAAISGNTVTYSVTDGGMGDSNAAPGVITDPAGAAVPGNAATNPIPTLGEWAMMALAALLALTTFVTMRRRMD